MQRGRRPGERERAREGDAVQAPDLRKHETEAQAGAAAKPGQSTGAGPGTETRRSPGPPCETIPALRQPGPQIHIPRPLPFATSVLAAIGVAPTPNPLSLTLAQPSPAQSPRSEDPS